MKTILPFVMNTILPFVIAIALSVSCTSKKESLFNGENLEGWTVFVEDTSLDPEDFFYVNEGMIETPGVPLGYLRTVKEYSDYHLHLEWRYPEEPTNSGVFLHVNGPDLLWPDHFQAQLKHGDAGDFIVHGVGQSATLNDTVYTSTPEDRPLIPKMQAGNENSAGKWNRYDITCSGSSIEIKVNGHLQNFATKCNLTGGAIGLQAEGSKIQFRNLWIESLK